MKVSAELISEKDAQELESFCKNATGDRKRAQVIKTMGRLEPNRRAWIEDEKPFISEILLRYPRFMDVPELVSLVLKLTILGL